MKKQYLLSFLLMFLGGLKAQNQVYNIPIFTKEVYLIEPDQGINMAPSTICMYWTPCQRFLVKLHPFFYSYIMTRGGWAKRYFTPDERVYGISFEKKVEIDSLYRLGAFESAYPHPYWLNFPDSIGSPLSLITPQGDSVMTWQEFIYQMEKAFPKLYEQQSPIQKIKASYYWKKQFDGFSYVSFHHYRIWYIAIGKKTMYLPNYQYDPIFRWKQPLYYTQDVDRYLLIKIEPLER